MGGNIIFIVLNSPLPKLSHPIKRKIWLKKNGAQSFFLHCYAMEMIANERQNNYPRELEQILGELSDIFQNPPHGIMPPRSRDHIIELMPRSSPIRKFSYKQSHRNKSKIKHLVQELLDAGIITRSKSPFSTLLIPIRKKMYYIDFALIIKH